MGFQEMFQLKVAKPLGQKYGWIVEVITILMPFIMQLIEQCTEDREDFMRLATAPTPFEAWWFKHQVIRHMRRNRVNVEMPLDKVATLVLTQTFNAAAEMSDSELMSAYDGLKV